jgi:hypothetical protein
VSAENRGPRCTRVRAQSVDAVDAQGVEQRPDGEREARQDGIEVDARVATRRLFAAVRGMRCQR